MSSPYKKVSFQTLGCKVNFAETSTIARDFKSRGYAQVAKNEVADLYIINTCSVTENANMKAKKAIRRALRISPQAKIAVIGCYAQLRPDELSQIPGVSFVFGAEEKFNICKYIDNSIKELWFYFDTVDEKYINFESHEVHNNMPYLVYNLA